jgi:hypothetical protein
MKEAGALQRRLFGLAINGGQPFPFGIETIVLILNPRLLPGVVICDFTVVRQYVLPTPRSILD